MRRKEAVDRGLKFAYSGRKQKKRQYRSIWIVRIGAAARVEWNELQPVHQRTQVEPAWNSTARFLPSSRLTDPAGFGSLGGAGEERIGIEKRLSAVSFPV